MGDRRAVRRISRWAIAAAALALAAAAIPGCYEQSDRDTEGLEVDCIDIACPWTIEQGVPKFGATWHEGDVGIDLSNDGPISVSMKVVLIGRNSRQFDLSASIFRDPGTRLHFDWEWFAAGSATGDTFWQRSPAPIGTDSTEASELGAYVLHRHVAVPPETAAFVLHVVKEGQGRVVVDQLTVDHFDHVGAY